MELKDITVFHWDHGPWLMPNPFNGIERLGPAIGMVVNVGSFGIHSMELKDTLVAPLGSLLYPRT